MDERSSLPQLEHLPTRRRMLTGITVALGSVASVPIALCQTQAPPTKEPPSSTANQGRTSLHQEVAFKASPQRLDNLLLDSSLFAAFTGMPAQIDRKPGGAFTTFGGLVVGRNIEIIPGQRIVQAWRPTHWDPGVYSIVRFELKPQGAETVIVLDHTGFPEGEYDHLNPGWPLRYWDPLRKYLG